MKDNNTLVGDIYAVFDKEISVTPEEAQSFGSTLANTILEKFNAKGNYLRLSNVGSVCRRQLWYRINTPDLGERLSGPARIKFLIGDITEAVILFLAKLAGHDVTDEQKSVVVHGVPGHIDAKINGVVTDVKSASPISFKKFERGLSPDEDAFGYRAQLGAYTQAEGSNAGNFLAVDKVLGTLCLDTHDHLPHLSLSDVQEVRQILDHSEPPPREIEDEKYGESGNRAIPSTPCGYCEFKDICWGNLVRYDYSKGPVWFTKIVREPKPTGKRRG